MHMSNVSVPHIERAYEREQKVRKAAEEEHKLNLRLRQALADGRENLSQVNVSGYHRVGRG